MNRIAVQFLHMTLSMARPASATPASAADLFELRPLLMELTGAMLLEQIDRVAAFGENGIAFAR